MNFKLVNFKSKSGALCAEKIEFIQKLNGARVFIETGTYLGDTVSEMSGIFEKIYSVELSEELHKNAINRFSGDPKVHLLCGDSAEKITESVRMANDDKVIFWLDAHWSGGNTAKSNQNTPIEKELRSISNLKLKSAIIIIDDIRYFTKIADGFEIHDANYGYPMLPNLLSEVEGLFPMHKPLLNGDLLFIFPREILDKVEISQVLLATNALRCSETIRKDYEQFEKLVSHSHGEEMQTILSLPDIFAHSLKFGIGGDYLYWRGLIFEGEGKFDRCRSDIDLARRCGVRIPPRAWE